MSGRAESLSERLRRLRREPEGGAEPVDTEAGAAGGALREQLTRHAARVARHGAPARDGTSGACAASTAGVPRDLAPQATDDGEVLARRTIFPRSHHHGTRELCGALSTDPAALSEAARDPRLAHAALERALFLDTETTGLSGGSGTYVFLVGLGRFVDAGFEVWQGFLAEPAGERALLAEAARRVADASVLVSFFGKAFDRHRLEDRMRVHGLAAPFASAAHLDLYWPLRRAHRGRYADCRLRTLERELAGVAREDDLPGSQAPAAWFDFVAGRAHRLEGVFRHNLEDVLSLVALLAEAAVPEARQATRRRRALEVRAEPRA